MAQCRERQYREKPVILNATQITRPDCIRNTIVGDWIVTQADGKQHRYSDAIFRAVYEIIPPRPPKDRKGLTTDW